RPVGRRSPVPPPRILRSGLLPPAPRGGGGAPRPPVAAGAPADSVAASPAPTAPFAFADFSWVPGNAGASERPLTIGPFTGEFRLDDAYHYSFSDPKDGTISGSSEVFRHGEFQVTQLGIGRHLFYTTTIGRPITHSPLPP